MKSLFCSFLVVFTGSLSFAADCDFIQFNACHSCDVPYAFPVSDAQVCSALCPQRIFKSEPVGNGVFLKTCALKKCPEHLSFQSVYGSCFSSEEESFSDDGVSVTENVCKDNIKDIFEEKKTCSKEKPLARWDGTCFSCSEERTIYLDASCNFDKNCETVCPERTILYSSGGNPPSIPNCPKDKPLMDENGICHSCDTNIEIPFEFNDYLCQKACLGIRHMENGNCVLK